MNLPSSCNTIQERILAGEVLDDTSQAHTLTCSDCGRFAADCLALNSAISDGLDESVVVPNGFADRVIASLETAPEPASRLDGILGRRWVQVALAHVGVAVAIVNLLRFVFSPLLPAASLGGVR